MKVQEQITIDNCRKTFVYTEAHVRPLALRRLHRRVHTTPNELNYFKDIGEGISAKELRSHQNLVIEQGYRVILNFNGKNYLLIYNK